jgi:hypothetical protein
MTQSEMKEAKREYARLYAKRFPEKTRIYRQNSDEKPRVRSIGARRKADGVFSCRMCHRPLNDGDPPAYQKPGRKQKPMQIQPRDDLEKPEVTLVPCEKSQSMLSGIPPHTIKFK